MEQIDIKKQCKKLCGVELALEEKKERTFDKKMQFPPPPSSSVCKRYFAEMYIDPMDVKLLVEHIGER